MEDRFKTKEQLIAELEGLRNDIVEMKNAEVESRWIEAALRESEQRYKRLVESITDYIYTVKVENGHAVSMTHGPGCLAITGYTSDYFQIYPHLWYSIIHEDDRKAALGQADDILSGRPVKPLEHRIIHNDGSIRWIRNTPVPHYDKEGRLISYDGLIAAITEEKKIEDELKAAVEYTRNIIESSMDMIIAVDNGRKITGFNKAAQETFGYALPEILGKDVDILYADPLEGLKVHNVTLKNGRHLQEIINRRKNEELFPSLLSASILRDAQGEIVGLMGISRDITERKRDEEALKESFVRLERANQEWRSTVDAIADPLFIHDGEFRIKRANRAYCAVADKPFKEIMGKPYFEIFPKMEGPFMRCMDPTEGEKEEEVRIPSINRIYKVKYYPVTAPGGKCLDSVHIMEDVTEQKKAEERLRSEIAVTTHLLGLAKATADISDVDQLMEQVVRCCQRILGCEICLAYLWDRNDKVFKPSKETGLANKFVSRFRTKPLNNNLVAKVFEDGKAAAFAMPAAGEIAPCIKDSDVGRLTVIPLIGRKGNLGLLIGVCPAVPGLKPVLTEREIRIMDGISHQVSIALEEARLYMESIDRAMELTRKIETIEAMHEIDRNILSTLDTEDVLDISVRMIGKVIGLDSAAVFLIDKEGKGFILSVGNGLDTVQKGAFIGFDETAMTDIVTTGRPQYISNLREAGNPLLFEKELIKAGFVSLIRVSLTIKNKIEGILSVCAKRASGFTPEDLSVLEKLASQVSVALENTRLITDLEELFMGTVKSLSSAMDAKSPWTAGHSERVTRIVLKIGADMGLSREELRDLELAGLLHDIGKIATFDFLLDKPGKLDPDEIEIVMRHPVKGAEILEPIKKFSNILPAILHHHENYDGTGYPDGLKGEDIPLMSRILAVADTYDAMRSDRPYRIGRTMDEIVAEFKRCSGSQFDPKVVETFLKLLKESGI